MAHAVKKMLIYLYTLEKPKIMDLESVKPTDEAAVWRNALRLYELAREFDLAPLADAAYEGLVERAPTLCLEWSTLGPEVKERHFWVVEDVWSKYPRDHQMADLKHLILKALAKVADLIAGYPALTDLLTSNKSFARDYINALSTEIGRKRKRE